LYPEELKFRESAFDRLAGDKKIREMILNDVHPDTIIKYWQKDLTDFLTIRKKYLIY